MLSRHRVHLASIHVYPLKGARGVALDHTPVLRGGLAHDRRFMLVDARGRFLSQREHPRLALVEASLDDAMLALSVPGHGAARCALVPAGPRRAVEVWGDVCDAVAVEGDVSALLSAHLGVACALVFMPDDVVRPVDPDFGAPGDRVGFADGFPLLLAGQASLDELTGRLPAPVPMDRFRPNLVVAGGVAYDEDRHARVCIGDVHFRIAKPCARCAVTTVDQATGEKGVEPLRTLASYRRSAGGVLFGQNLIPDAEGSIAVGDRIAYG